MTGVVEPIIFPKLETTPHPTRLMPRRPAPRGPNRKPVWYSYHTIPEVDLSAVFLKVIKLVMAPTGRMSQMCYLMVIMVAFPSICGSMTSHSYENAFVSIQLSPQMLINPHRSSDTGNAEPRLARRPSLPRTFRALRMGVDGEWEHGEDICGDGGCIKAILQPGNGPCPTAGARVSVEYTIRIGKDVIDSTELHGEPFKFELGQRPSDAIGCWEGLSFPVSD